MKKIGLALGGGGAKGLAHIPLLETLDEMGVRPHMISGTSIGAIMGAIYASGISGADIRKGVSRLLISKEDSLKDVLTQKELLRWFDFIDPDFGRGGLFKGERFLRYLFDLTQKTTFDELEIPLKIVATDYWTSDEVVMETGDLISAVKASMSLPGIFTPVERDGLILIDGGGVNPVPYNLLTETCDIVIAIDVLGKRMPGKHKMPWKFDAVISTFQIMQESIVAEKLGRQRPDIYIKPEIDNVEILEFFKVDKIYEQTKPAQAQLREALEKVMND
jgi:NTE family protein